jgi:metal-sulfur cluster biosynthetic enzyme
MLSDDFRIARNLTAIRWYPTQPRLCRRYVAFRIYRQRFAKDLSNRRPEEVPQGSLNESMVWDQLKTVFDPEIPVNLVDLGLIYACQIQDDEQNGKRIDIKMSMTAPGCGMANVLKADVEHKLALLPEVKEVHVEVVFDPPWHPGLMSEAAKPQLGLDLDLGPWPLTQISRWSQR